MKVSWPQVGVLALIIIPITILVGFGRDANALMQWLSVMVPSILAGAAYSEAQKARQNTNGRMSELIRANRELGDSVKHLRKTTVVALPESPHIVVDHAATDAAVAKSKEDGRYGA